MPEDRAEYHNDIIRAHRQAIAALRELLATEEDRKERRRLATTLLRARPLKEVVPPSPAQRERVAESGGARPGEGALPPSPGSAGEGARRFGRADEGALRTAPTNAAAPTHQDAPRSEHDDATNEFDDLYDNHDDLDNPADPANRAIAALAHQAQHGPDHLGALSKLEAIMRGDFSPLERSSGASESP